VRYLVSFAVGLVLALAVWAVSAAVGYPEYAGLADAIVGLLGLVIAFALATGLNLGMWLAIKDVDGDRVPADAGAALCVAAFSVALLLSGLVTALAT
jgi:hypothetical protein